MDRRLTKEALRLLEHHQPFVRATVVHAVGSVPGKVGASLLMRSDGTTLGTVGGAALEERVKDLARAALNSRTGGLHHFDLRKWQEGGLPSLCGGEVDISVEYVAAHPRILLWGGGHVAEAVGRLLPTLEYDFAVADDRPDWVSADRFPGAERREVVAATQLLALVPPAEYTHLYILGYDAAKDTDLLEIACRDFPGEIGVIASASKRTHMFAELRRRGVPEAAIARVRSPVGVAIGARTPAEIAVSIVAEFVRDANSGPRAMNPRGSPPEDG
ncbi:MAG TPA: XdhC/CoxI family protein [Thermoplasmata archaeon]|nr:XdhC/CoxI family protein [Thermoplasmata archaeon]